MVDIVGHSSTPSQPSFIVEEQWGLENWCLFQRRPWSVYINYSNPTPLATYWFRNPGPRCQLVVKGWVCGLMRPNPAKGKDCWHSLAPNTNRESCSLISSRKPPCKLEENQHKANTTEGRGRDRKDSGPWCYHRTAGNSDATLSEASCYLAESILRDRFPTSRLPVMAIYSFSKDFQSIYCVPGSVLSIKDTTTN